MYKALKDNKIIAISNTDSKFLCLICDKIENDPDHIVEDYEQYNGEYLLKEDVPAPTHEEQRQKRALAYKAEVDPITCHISRLCDEQHPDEQKILELLQERVDKINEIKERYPYPEEESSG